MIHFKKRKERKERKERENPYRPLVETSSLPTQFNTV
jgi:hypothetical protein